MKKVFKVEGLQCANCAAKIEQSIAKLDGVQSCTVSIMTGRLTIDAADDQMEAILSNARKLVSKIERGAVLV